MATTTHTIYSRYDPNQRELLEVATGQLEELAEHDKWEAESLQTFKRRKAQPPVFVPATVHADEWGSYNRTDNMNGSRKERAPDSGSAQWYQSLTANLQSTTPKSLPEVRESSAPPLRLRSRSPKTGALLPSRKKESVTKNDWFILNAVQSEPSSSQSSPAPTLADILARDPPPRPEDKRFKAPIWLALGPSNRGYEMLQSQGWNEGEGLGPNAVRVPSKNKAPKLVLDEKKRERSVVKQEERIVALDSDGELSEIRKVDVIDMTLSDSVSEEEDDADNYPDSAPPSPYGQKVLLTPLPIVLKSDRLGVGLKAKTEGPYKASRKRITHGSAALSMHIRKAEELKRRKAQMGRGRRGLAREKRREGNERNKMLAYMNE